MISSHKDRTIPPEIVGWIFVFGSNKSGIHGAGAAEAAFKFFQAKWGEWDGLTGNAYAIPTKNETITRTLSLNEIKKYVDKFNIFVSENQDKHFWLTRIGCGLAGHQDSDVAPMFDYFPNVSYPEEWVRFISKKLD